MSDNRKYYYLKLKESYFDEDSIVLLESMQDGVLYSNILLKLYLKSLKNGGRLQLDENIPYTAQMIATITRQQIGTVERTLQIFLKLGLVELLDSGAYYMSNIELLIGQSSTEGERKRAARLENRALLAAQTNSGHLSDIRPPEIEIELEKEIEIKREKETGQTTRACGRYQNVFLTVEELAELQAEFPTVWQSYVEKLSAYMKSTGKQYRVELFGKEQLVPSLCRCEQERIAAEKAAEQEQARLNKIRRLKANALQDKALLGYTFDRYDGKNPVMKYAHRYVEHWQEMKECGQGLLLWGGVGTGKTFAAACIAHALTEQSVPVLMTDFSKILNSLSGMFSEDRNKYLASFCSFSLPIIDDLGIERNSEYALEQV